MPQPSFSGKTLIRFGAFEVDLPNRELRKRGHRIRLQDQPFAVLATLLEHPGELVPRETLQQYLWSADTFVDFDHGLNNAIKRLREALCDSADTPRFIETVPRSGYRFIAPVTVEDLSSAPSPSAPQAPLADVPAASIESSPRGGGEGHKRYFGVAIALAALAAASCLVWLLILRLRATPSINSIAVLPLTNLDGNNADDYFADGMTEELITELAKRGAFRIVSRTSIMRYKGTARPLPDIARELSVDALIEGTVRRAGDRIRITVQLIAASPERHMWADAYEGDIRDVIGLQRNLASDIVGKIRARLAPPSGPATAPRRIDPAAYESYLRGRYFLARRSAESMNKAVVCFLQAVQKEPQFADAYGSLADAYVVLGSYQVLPPRESFLRAKEYANKALQLDSSLSDAYAARAIVMSSYEFDWAAADRDFQRAVTSNPNSANAHHWYAEHLLGIGKVEQALAEMKRARDLDPLSLPFNSTLGRIYRDAHRHKEAMQQCQVTLELDPNYLMAHWCLGQAYVGEHQYTLAVAEFEKAATLGTTPLLTRDLGWAYAMAGDRAKANAILQALMRKQSAYIPPYDIGIIYGALGQKDQAFKWLQQAYDERDSQISYLPVDPEADPLRSDPRFRNIIQQLKIP